jgi:phage repressor protein C with HTH and peptisase S24 domain
LRRNIRSDAGAFAARLGEVVAREKSLSAFARKVGISSTALRKWLDGTSQPSRQRLIAAARAAGVSVEWLATGDGPGGGRKNRAAATGGAARGKSGGGAPYVFVSRISARLRGGRGGQPRQLLDQIAFRADWLRKSLGFDPTRLLAMEIESGGNGIGLLNGDVLLIDTGDTDIADSALYALRIGDGIVVRRVYRRVDGTVVVEGGSGTEEIVPCAVKRLKAIGRVVWYCRRL